MPGTISDMEAHNRLGAIVDWTIQKQDGDLIKYRRRLKALIMTKYLDNIRLSGPESIII